VVELFGKEFAREQVRQVLEGMVDLAQDEGRVRLSRKERERYINEVLDMTHGLRAEDPG
jgi:hypothetical protein